jgi:DNA polymerase-3 subunit epsilon
VLDTETTGLDPNQGHRIIEIAAVEMVGRRLTRNNYHVYLNPEREIDPGAQEVHGISGEFLQDKPRFLDEVQDFLAFVSGAELIIHNAPFDVGFLNRELGLLGMEPIGTYVAGVVDTLRMAKELRPGKRNNLDALCEHYGVDNSGRTLHGALLDAELLADVYLAMTRGQESLMILDQGLESPGAGAWSEEQRMEKMAVSVLRASAEELARHQAYLEDVAKASGGKCLWLLPDPGVSA